MEFVMDYLTFKTFVTEIKIGKHLPTDVYLHKNTLNTLPDELVIFIKENAKRPEINKKSWNLLKLNKRDFKLSFLNYPTFDNESYPALKVSYSVDIERDLVRVANYANSKNPPILHRKETFVLDDYPLRDTFVEITKEGEAIGLYEKTKSIGFKQNWLKLIDRKGYFLDDEGRLQHKQEVSPPISENTLDEIERHRTAINRNQLSAPMKILARHGYLDGKFSLLDYGCGKGDDLRELELHKLDCIGWDPNYKPDGKLEEKDIVNLGFVLNVIEDRSERDLTLKKAWGYAKSILIVSVMIAGRSTTDKFASFNDGVVTSINTFQKYYSQAEFSQYIEYVLDEKPIPVGQGIVVVFKDKLQEQQFLLDRQYVNRQWRQLSKPRVKVVTKKDRLSKYEKHQPLFDDFWEATLDLGRIPANDEFEFSDEIRRVAGSHNKALEMLEEIHGSNLLFESEFMRQGDLLVYFTLGLFEERKPYTRLPNSLKRDVKTFFETHSNAIKLATKKLYSVGKPEIIEALALEAYEELPKGIFVEDQSWTIHSSLLNYLPVELRIYVGCASQLLGSIEEYDLIKIYFKSGEIDLLKFDDWQKDSPLLIEEIKILLLNQDVKYTYYDSDYNPQLFQDKHLFTADVE